MFCIDDFDTSDRRLADIGLDFRNNVVLGQYATIPNNSDFTVPGDRSGSFEEDSLVGRSSHDESIKVQDLQFMDGQTGVILESHLDNLMSHAAQTTADHFIGLHLLSSNTAKLQGDSRDISGLPPVGVHIFAAS